MIFYVLVVLVRKETIKENLIIPGHFLFPFIVLVI